ncbi:MAG TPA: glycosyltransferase family 39 protein [Methylomirabilota bacterium]
MSERARTTLETGLILVVALALVLNVLGLGWGLPLRGYHAWDVDAVAPLGPLIAAKRMLVDEWWNSAYYNKYPMGHFFILMGTYTPYVGYLWLTGRLQSPSEVYPFGLEDPETALTVLTLIARSVNVLMGVGIVLCVYLTARRFGDRRAALFSALTIALSPPFIFYAHTGNIDTPSLFWSALALLALGRLVAGQCRLRHYLLCGAAVGMAAATKEQTLGLFLLLPLSVLVLHARHAGAARLTPWSVIRAAGERGPLAALGAAGGVFVLATHLVFNWHGNVLRLRWRLYGIHPIYGTEYPGGRPEVDGAVDAFAEMAVHTLEAMNPVLFVAGVAGLLVLTLRRPWARHFALPLLSYTAFAVALFPFFRARFVMQAVLVLAFFAGPVLAYLWTLGVKRSRALAAAVVLIWGYSFVYGVDVNYLLIGDARYAAETWLEARAAPGVTVEAFSGPTYLPRFPRHLTVRQSAMTATELAGLDERAPDLIVLSSAFSLRFREGTEAGELLARLLGGDFGYWPVQTFRREPLVSPRLFAGLSPEIVVLARHR